MRKYFKIFTCCVQDASAYRGNLIVGVLSNFIITAVMFYIWKVIYETNVTIDNYNWEDMKIYLFISFICNYGSLVKRLRRRPLTAESGVRFPYELLCYFYNSPTRNARNIVSGIFKCFF